MYDDIAERPADVRQYTNTPSRHHTITPWIFIFFSNYVEKIDGIVQKKIKIHGVTVWWCDGVMVYVPVPVPLAHA